MEAFAQFVAAGETQAQAYRLAYKRPTLLAQDAAERASKLAADLRVRAKINQLRGKIVRKNRLTLNDRLGVLDTITQDETAARADRIRAIEVANRISPTGTPDRQEITGKDGAPIAVAATANVTVTGLSIREKAERLRAAKAEREKENAAP